MSRSAVAHTTTTTTTEGVWKGCGRGVEGAWKPPLPFFSVLTATPQLSLCLISTPSPQHTRC